MGEIADVVGGGTPKTSNIANFGGDIPWITPADLSGYTEKFISKGSRNITQEGLDSSGARLMPAGTVLFSSRAPIGYVAIASNPVCTNQGFKSFVLREGLTPDFVYYYLQNAKKLAIGLASGTTFLEISGKKAAQIPIPVPPPEDQQRIVAEIEKQFTRLEAGLAGLRRAQANLERYRAAVLKAACEGKLVPNEVELAQAEGRKVETGAELLERILAERRKNWTGRGQYKEPSTPDISKLPALPEGWSHATIGHILRIRNGYAFKSADYCEAGIPLIRQADLVGRLVSVSKSKRLPAKFLEVHPDFIVRKGDLLIGMSGALGKISEYLDEEPALQNQRTGLLLIEKDIRPSFAKLVLQYVEDQIVAEGKGVAVQNVSAAEIEKCAFMLPPSEEQRRIVDETERRLSVVEELEAVISVNLQRATRLRKSILQRAFAGELVP